MARESIPVQVPPDPHWHKGEQIRLEAWYTRPTFSIPRYTLLAVVSGEESGEMDITAPDAGRWVPEPLAPGALLHPGQLLGRMTYPAQRRSSFVDPLSHPLLPPAPSPAPPPVKVRSLVERLREHPSPPPPPPRYGREPGESLRMKRSRLYVTEAQEQAIKDMVKALAELVPEGALRVTQAEVMRAIVEHIRALPEPRLLELFLCNREQEAELGFGSASRSWE